MQKIWLKSYPQGVPAEINPDEYRSLVDLFKESVEHYAALPAFYNLGTTITYRELDQYTRAVAAYLQQSLHLKKGDRLAIMMPNLLQYPVVLLGALRAGLIVVNVNPLYTAPELIHQLNDARAETIVVLSTFASTVQAALKETTLKNIIVTDVGDLLPWPKAFMMKFYLKYIKRRIPFRSIPGAISFKKAMQIGSTQTLLPVAISQNDIAFLQYTGGTTGVSKGAMLTHRNMISNILQARAWFCGQLEPEKEIVITALPLYHIFSLTANCLYFLSLGGLNVLITNPRDIPGMISELRRFKFTALTGVNTLFNGLIKNAAFSKVDFSALKLTLGGGMAVQGIVAERWQTITGQPLLEAYGLTETSPCVCINPLGERNRRGTVGLPVSSTDVAILDDDHNEVVIGMAGELAVKGPQVMRGYWNNLSETEKVFTKSGWLLTGDIASMDEEGYVKILERKKDMILVSGFNVYPNEVEDVLVTMPGILEAAVVGVPDENSGEAVKALVVTNHSELTAADIIQFCRTKLTGYKIPKYVEFCKDLPKTNVGKILRRELRSAPLQG